MSVNDMPELFQYVIIDVLDNNSEHIFTSDSKGWEEMTTSLVRGSLHGINSEQSAPLSFSYDAKDFLKSKFETYGAFSYLKLRLDKRNEDWTYSEYITLVFDFKTYKDDGDYITIELKENSLRELIDSNMDTEYDVLVDNDIAQPTLIPKVPFLSNNIIQCYSGKSGDLFIYQEYTHNKTYAYFPNGERSTREFSQHFSFVNDDGSPYTHFEFSVVQDVTMSLTIASDMIFVFDALLPHTDTSHSWLGDRNDIKLKIWIERDGNKFEFFEKIYSNIDSVYYSDIGKYRWTCDFNFGGREIKTGVYNFLKGDHIVISPTIYGINKAYTDSYLLGDITKGSLRINSCANTYIKIENEVNPNSKLYSPYFFKHEDIISRLLNLISPNIVLNYNISYQNYMPMITSDTTLKLNNYSVFDGMETHVIRVKLKDLLDSLDRLYDIGIDISGNVLTIDYIQNFYNNSKSIDLENNKLTISYLNDKTYNNIKVGKKTDDNFNVLYGKYGFFGEKSYITKSQQDVILSSDKKELDLSHPYKIDSYSIDKLFIESIGSEKSDSQKSSSVLAIVAFETTITDAILYQYYAPVFPVYMSDSLSGNPSDYYNIPFTPRRMMGYKKKTLATLFIGSEKKLYIGSSEYDISLESRMSWENSNIVENETMDISSETPLFLPIKAQCDSAIDYDILSNLRSNKYKYVIVTDKYGRQYKCWLSKVITNIGKTSSNECELLLKEL